MADQKFTPRGSIGTNRFKKSDTHPHLTGKVFLTSEIVANIQEQVSEGVEYPVVELAVWKKTSSKDGSKFLSVAASKPWKKPDDYVPRNAPPSSPAANSFEMDDEIPF